MEENVNIPVRRPIRRRKTKMEIFKEAYLPYLILMAAAVLIVIFIIGALVRNSNEAKTDTPDTAQTSILEITEL